nr:MAG TPA: stage V sporulation protein T [Caudoviricetes sp.]
MKATGIVRRIDDLGRIVIPKEIRRTLHLREGDPLELFLDKNCICLQKYSALGTLSEDYLRIATTMAAKSKLHPIAIYDTEVKLYGSKKFPLYVPDDWDYKGLTFTFNNSYGVYKISNSDGTFGYVVCELADVGCEMDMIARYLSAVMEN